MDCKEVREELAYHLRGQLAPDVQTRVAAHVQGCAACTRALAAEEQLSELLEQRLPRHAAPLSLQRRLADLLPPAIEPAPAARWGHVWRARLLSPLASAVAAAVLTVVGLRVLHQHEPPSESPAVSMVDEAVNDHLRVVYSSNPVEIESGGIHQVKPWFTGRLDFAPRVAFSGDDEFPLVGGSVGYFHDRKAAVFVFKHALHTISLLVFRAEGFDWPTTHLTQIGRLAADVQTVRGFSVVLWRDGELGYCLVSDVDRAELERLATKVAGDAP
jgi:anti-sigma factor RsiW